MNQQELDKFTLLIENYNYDNNETITPQSLHKELWGGLSALKNTANKEALLDGWKYSSAFSAAESTHQTKVSHFKKLKTELWEQSFALYFWMCIYH